jgi:hypothetical protein
MTVPRISSKLDLTGRDLLEVVCTACARHDTYACQAIMALYGASVDVQVLRNHLAIHCRSGAVGAAHHLCEAYVPDLVESGSSQLLSGHNLQRAITDLPETGK